MMLSSCERQPGSRISTASLRAAVRTGHAAISVIVGTLAVALSPVTAHAQFGPPELIEAAKKEGKLVFYTAMDLQLAERFGRTFEQKYPGIAVRVERSGAERVFQRIDQEYRSNIHAVDVVNTADQAHCIIWKRNGWLAAYLPEEVAPSWSRQRTRRRASPTCSIPNGRARWSRPIRLTAARS